MAFRDDLHAARSRADLLEETNQRLAGELEAAYRGRFPRLSVRRSLGLMLLSLFCLTTLGGVVALGALRVPRPEPVAPAPPALAPPPPADPDQLVTVDLRLGDGRMARAGDKLRVHYVGTLLDGTEFDGSRKRGEPFTFTLGKGQVIKGWEYGVEGMRVGGLRKLVIPPSLAYGDRGAPPTIAPSTPLVFEVELLAIE
jgi:hypothetical protein